VSAGADRRAAVRGVDNTIHDLIAVSNDLRRHIRADLAARGHAELRPSFAPLLTRIRAGGVPQGRLAEAMGVSPQAASQTVGLAEQAGYVTREPNPDDRRSKLVVLTDAGRAFVADGGAAIAARAAVGVGRGSADVVEADQAGRAVVYDLAGVAGAAAAGARTITGDDECEGEEREAAV